MRLASLGTLDTRGPAFFRYRAVGEHIVVTNLEGRWLLLSHDEFSAFATGKLNVDSPLYTRLSEGNFLRESYDVVAASEGLRRRKRFVHYGPNLHLMVVTLRCNETCVYCHASRADMDRVDTDMSRETAEACVEMALKSTSPGITIEFQGGEPLVAFDIVKHTVQYALSKNRAAGKQLEFTMVSNLALMDEEKLAWLVEHRVQICTSIDGPRALHDKQRKLRTLSAYDEAAGWIARINEAYGERGLDPTLYHVEALLTTTKAALHQPKAIVDTYVALGCRALFLRPIDPFGFADKTRRIVDYPRVEYLRFYAEALDYMIALNQGGTEILERYAAIFLTKILSGEDPNFLDIRSPGGAGIGQLAYNYDGKIFSSDEGRMLHAMGDSTFLIGQVGESSYRDVVGHPTIRAMSIASNLDQQPDCVNCAYQPYCGTQPEHNHKTLGTMFGRMRESAMCAVHKGIQDILFERLGRGGEVREVLERWTTVRPRDHFLHDPAPE
ncbi:MAG: His-Xaa-Ser system radical SAM maturase HxsB [Nannocystaceae bacterium]|nr:His-Xaa-Ser system radical SAM maturase HxsB [Nannocystaceae bacterium]